MTYIHSNKIDLYDQIDLDEKFALYDQIDLMIMIKMAAPSGWVVYVSNRATMWPNLKVETFQIFS